MTSGTMEEQSSGMLLPGGNTSLNDGSFYSRSSFNAPGIGEAYDKTLFNLCYLIQMQLGMFFKQGKWKVIDRQCFNNCLIIFLLL